MAKPPKGFDETIAAMTHELWGKGEIADATGLALDPGEARAEAAARALLAKILEVGELRESPLLRYPGEGGK